MKPEDFTWIEDLIWLDGPLLSVFHDTESKPWLAHWYDCDETVHFWIFVQVDPDVILELRKGKLPLLDVLLGGLNPHLARQNRDLLSMEPMDISAIPIDALPDAGICIDKC